MPENPQTENTVTPEQPISTEHQLVIEQQVERAVRPIRWEDPDTAAYYETVLTDYYTSLYDYLQRLSHSTPMTHVLHPASGYERIPELVFGNRLVKTSLEEHDRNEPIPRQYFDGASKSLQAVADNNALPFDDKTFDAVLWLDTSLSLLEPSFDELNRVLKAGGCMVFADNDFVHDVNQRREYLNAQSAVGGFMSELSGTGLFILRKESS